MAMISTLLIAYCEQWDTVTPTFMQWQTHYQMGPARKNNTNTPKGKQLT